MIRWYIVELSILGVDRIYRNLYISRMIKRIRNNDKGEKETIVGENTILSEYALESVEIAREWENRNERDIEVDSVEM